MKTSVSLMDLTKLSLNHREVQKTYWTEHSNEATVEAMMLDSQAATIDKEERPEVLSMLGSVEEKRIIELGAGIGRFTGSLAATARNVTAVDFMANSIEENRRINGHRKNVRYIVGDATQLDIPAASCDVVFSNWLLMYLSDEECLKLAADALSWVGDDGLVFFRESCFKQSGDRARKNNPTHYRNPREYFAIFDSVEIQQPDGQYARFELVSCKCVDTYVRVKQNQNQICWKWRKVLSAESKATEFRHFLDEQQYSTNGILRYERIFGPGFVSTGGLHTTQEFVESLNLKPGQRVLDIGCGIGGGDFYMAQQYGVAVHGVDLSVNMVLLALERAFTQHKNSKVSFEIADVTTCEVKDGSYDVIYSRDTILHIQDKPALFRRFMKMLKPGGKLLISDYCRAPQAPSEGFAAYIKQRGYDLHPVADYAAMLQAAGFVEVVGEDRTWQFRECLAREREMAVHERAAFVKEFSQKDFDYLMQGWQDKLERVAEGEQCWGLFKASAPV